MASVINILSRNVMNTTLLRRCKRINLRCLSAGSQTNPVAGNCQPDSDSKAQYREIPDFSKPLDNKNWVSYGFDEDCEKTDVVKMHMLSFLTITVIFVWGGFYFMYIPDMHHKHWAKREAYIRLYEREQLGLEPISPDYIDPEKMILPSDEELGDAEIII